MARNGALRGFAYGRGMSRMPADGYKSNINPNAYNLWRDWYFGVNAVVGKSIGNVTITATGTSTIKGTLSQSIGDITVTLTGISNVKGALSQSVGNVGLTATAKVYVNGVLVQSIGNVSLTGTGISAVAGELAKSVGNVGITATGTVGGGGSDVNGYLSQPIGDITLYATDIFTTSVLTILADLTNYVIVEDSANLVDDQLDMRGTVKQNAMLTTEVMIYDEIC
jgi:hypothetical protein